MMDFAPRKRWPACVAVEIDTQSRLDRAAAAQTTRADADVAHRDAPPTQVGRVVGVVEEVVLQVLPVGRMEHETNVVAVRPD